MSYDNDNRTDALEKIDFYKKWLKASIIKAVIQGAETVIQIIYII